jgi:Fe2+ or Zn2+ uptake regulation protein
MTICPDHRKIYIQNQKPIIMTRVDDIIANIGKVRITGAKQIVLEYITARKDEVFTREELAKALPNIAPRTIDQYAQQLVREGKIDKIKFDRKTYYGDKEAIKKIKDAAKRKL